MSPTEAERLCALSDAESVIDPSRIINQTDLQPSQAPAAPQFSTEILRNDSGISTIGLVPKDTDRTGLVNRLETIAGSQPVTDLMQIAAYPEPWGWRDAMDFAGMVLTHVPRSKIPVEAGRVEVIAIVDSVDAKTALEQTLEQSALGVSGLR